MADEDHVKLYARVSAQQFLMKRLLAQLASDDAEDGDPWQLLEGLKADIAASWPKNEGPQSGGEDESLTGDILEETLLAVQEIIEGAQDLVGRAEDSEASDDEGDDEDDEYDEEEGDEDDDDLEDDDEDLEDDHDEERDREDEERRDR